MCCRGEDRDVDSTALEKDKNITRQLETDRKRLNEEIYLLLLGAGESGKSTFAKQMKIIHMEGFNPEEKLEYVSIIHGNIYESIQNITKASHLLEMPFNPNISAIADIFSAPYSKPLTPDLAEKIEEFYKDETVLEIASKRADYQLLDNTFYFAENIRRICKKNYIPSDADILQARAQSTGVTQLSFAVGGKKFVLVDVGGQRSERKKWIHCFDKVNGVVFCVGISAFDQTLYEDNETNRMHEALKLFHEICTSKWFTATAIILFLNKADIFKKKLEDGKSISIAFPEFEGGSDYDSSVRYIMAKFRDVEDPVTEEKKEIFCHVTTATDTENVRFVFNSVREFVVTEALRRCGLIISY
jgi:GTPase SAR1 family protein